MHLGVRVRTIRMLFVVSGLAFGAGVLAYVFLWMAVPTGDPAQAAQEQARSRRESPLSNGNTRYDPAHPDAAQYHDTAQSGESNPFGMLHHASTPSLIALAGFVLLAVSLTTALTGRSAILMITMLLALAGVGVAWLRYNAPRGQLWSMLAGVGLLFAAYTLYTLSNRPEPTTALRAIVSGLALLIGVGLAVVPWANALVRDLGTERALKEREEERADMAAHLHDGVLQTLALIQLHSTEPQTVTSLAHSQERELRNWLYQDRPTSERSVSSGLRAIAAQVEDEHGRPIEIVTVGDAQPSPLTDALLDASKQAMINAVTHGGEPVSVYGEAREDMIEVFVRDHGDGFDVHAIPKGRLGIQESIVGRIKRRGGTVEIVSRPQWGTEVRMHMPLAAPNSAGTHEEERI